MSERGDMEAELKKTIVPVLRSKGFKGSFPHFRRERKNGIDLFTFQFDKWGGGFVIEITHCPSEGVTTHWGKHVAPSEVTAWDLHPDKRHRIQPLEGSGVDSWFRFDHGRVESAAQQVLSQLQNAEAWWESHA